MQKCTPEPPIRKGRNPVSNPVGTVSVLTAPPGLHRSFRLRTARDLRLQSSFFLELPLWKPAGSTWYTLRCREGRLSLPSLVPGHTPRSEVTIMRWKTCSKTMAVLAILTAVLALTPRVWAAGSNQAGGTGKAAVTVLYNFGGTELIYPAGPIVAQGRDGNLYSTTTSGGMYNDGVVFRLTPNGKATVIQQLDTNYGASGLTLGADGNFYGTTFYGGIGSGYGTVFEITPRGNLTTLYDFSGQNYDAYPFAPPIQGSDGKFYGTARGGFYGNSGTVYKMTPSGEEATLF